MKQHPPTFERIEPASVRSSAAEAAACKSAALCSEPQAGIGHALVVKPKPHLTFPTLVLQRSQFFRGLHPPAFLEIAAAFHSGLHQSIRPLGPQKRCVF